MFLNIVVLSLLFAPSFTFLDSAFSKIKEKAKAYYKSKFGHDSTNNFLGYDMTEYPGGNQHYRTIQTEKWNEYYNCLQEQSNDIGEHGSAVPEAVLGFEGLSIRFDCEVCLSPLENSQQDSVEWYWAPRYQQKLEFVEYSEHILVSPNDKSLTLYNLVPSQTGQYVCFLGKTANPPSFLTVVNSLSNLEQVHPDAAPKGPYAKPPQYIEEYGMYLYTEWGEWSPCSTCGKVGKRHRTGYCAIISEAYFNSSQFTTVIKEKENFTGENDESEAENIKNEFELLKIFKYGIPCQSHILPFEIRNLPQVVNRKNEVMIGFCKKECHNNEVFEVKDKNGNVIETANNSAGIYSMLQDLPPAEPSVERTLIYAGAGENLTLSCPGNLNSDTPVQWQIKSQLLIPELIAQKSKGRITISVLDRLIIYNAHLTDTNVYSCWQNNELAGLVRLIVEKKIKLQFNHHIMLFGIVVILSTFLYVYLKAFLGRKHAQMASK